MLSSPELAARRQAIAGSADLTALLERLSEQARPVLARPVEIPAAKALLTADGGACPEDGTALDYDPWSPSAHACPHCGRKLTGERHDRAWARFQHLWLAERAAHLAAVAALGEVPGAAERAGEILGLYAERYPEFPNRDNVLGPSRLFFSTYLESIWITNYLAAASLLREAELLDPGLVDPIGAVADEAANLIGEFDEGFSNRQTWHNAALAAIAFWFEDEELATRVVEGPTGAIAHLLRGFGDDGMWYEGENYHLFALRGQLLAMGWARQAGVDLLGDARLADRVAAALRAPAITALPDYTFPARKDSRYGVSLAQPMYLELWEIGLARSADEGSDLWAWLRQLYQSPAAPAQRFDSYLHDAGRPPPPESRSRADLSWWSLLEMAPDLPSTGAEWSPGNAFLEGQGLAILRTGRRYASLECGRYGGGHGHPDRLHLTLHADGCHWLPDPGTDSYVSRDLFWYRSTLAHNAPRLDGRSQPAGDAQCANFDEQGEWVWAGGTFGPLTRTLVAGPRYLLDVLDLSAPDEHLLELPWHIAGRVEVATAGQWSPATLADEFVTGVERFIPASDGPLVLRAQADAGSAQLSVHLLSDGELLRARAPGLPGSAQPAPFFLVRARGYGARVIAALEPSTGAQLLRSVRASGDLIEVEVAGGTDHHARTPEGWDVEAGGTTTRLRGARRPAEARRPLIDPDRPVRPRGLALHAAEPPALDGTLDGFDTSEPLTLDYEDQYRRSEEPYGGPEEFSATATVNWDQSALYLAVDVLKPEVVVRPPGSPALLLDNEPDDIHVDGVQLYLRPAADAPIYGFLVVPSEESGAIRAHGIGGTAGADSMVQGAWQPTEAGYALTLAIGVPEWHPRTGETMDFDLLVNRMEQDRLRRAGQLVWSGGGGWVYLRGDRQDPAGFGALELR